MAEKQQKSLRAIVSGGGTGGHIYPALAIAAALQAQLKAEILYMGAQANLHGGPPKEKELAENAGYAYIGVKATGLHRKSPRIIKDLWINYRGVGEAKEQIRKFRPDIVVGCGGYAMAPVLKAAANLHIPIVLHEQNAFPGWANRFLARKAAAICLTFEAARAYFPQRTAIHLTGLPVRQQIVQPDRAAADRYWQIAPTAPRRPTLLVTGGSQGARQLNRAVSGCYAELLAAGLRIIHLTGEQHIQECRQAAAKLPQKENLHLVPYLKEMQHALAEADLVVGRAGASFLAEIALVGLPAILVPYPYAANDHQTHNAKAFAAAGAACVVKDESCVPDRLCKLVLELIADQDHMQKMGQAAQSLAKASAADDIVEIIRTLTVRA